MGADELDLPLCAYAAAARRQGGQRRAPAKPAQQRWRAPRTHLHAEMVRQRRNPEPRDRSEVKRALEALTQGDAEAVEALLSRAGEEPVAEEWQQRYKEGGQAYWDQFYRQSTVNFFKDRNYLREEFGELMPADIAAAPKRWVENLSAEDRPAPETAAEAAEAAAGRKVLLELGCAVGNGALPMLRANRGLFAFACDLSPVAIRLLREKEEYACGRCLAFACDVTRGEGEQPTPEHTPMESLVPADSVDFATLLFVVSAIDPAKHRDVYARICGRLRPGGLLLVRDYGRGDLAQLRFAPNHWLGGDLYVRGDGTLACFLTVEGLIEAMEAVGFETVECEYKTNNIVNRGTGVTMPRVWVQGKFRRRQI